MDSRLGASSSGYRKSTRQSEDEVPHKSNQFIGETLVENEYEHFDEENDFEDEKILGIRKKEFRTILKAQEPDTMRQDGDIKITPFNLQEELEEGELDTTGEFVIRKELYDEEDNDTWAESVDWAAVEQKEKALREGKIVEDAELREEPELEVTLDKITCYKKMLRIMRPDETVQKSIRRLGNSIPKRRLKKSKFSEEFDSTASAVIAEARTNLDSMIELAHLRLGDGDTDIYQKSFEDLEEAIN